MFPHNYHVVDVDNIKSQANKFLMMFDSRYPNGRGADEQGLVRYVQANSSSSFLGIQKLSSSINSINVLHDTLNLHSNPDIKSRP